MARKAADKFGDEISNTELASLCEITERRVRQLIEEGVFEKLSRGRCRRKGCAAAYKDFCVKAEMDRRDQAENSKEKFEAERARKLKRENDLGDSLVIETDTAIAALDFIVGIVRTELSGIPARITDEVGDRRRIEHEVDKILTGIAERLAQSGEDLRAGRDPYDAGAEVAA